MVLALLSGCAQPVINPPLIKTPEIMQDPAPSKPDITKEQAEKELAAYHLLVEHISAIEDELRSKLGKAKKFSSFLSDEDEIAVRSGELFLFYSENVKKDIEKQIEKLEQLLDK